MVSPLQIGGGITIEGGITIGTAPSFTLTSADFTGFGGGSGVTTNGTAGFTTNGVNSAGQELYAADTFTSGFASVLAAFYATNSLATDYTGYIYSVTWGPGSTPGSSIVLIGTDTSQLLISPVSTANNDWQTPGTDPYALQSAAGTYNFPATFTLYQPVIHDLNNWC
jgi:hypothetical protein